MGVIAPPLSVYLHLPFCARKCHYCDFNSRPGSAEERRDYLDALRAEIDRRAETLGGSHVRTIFFGGGTPTVYEAEELEELLARLREVIAPLPEIEITCEANPETVDLPKLQRLREAGFNRLSIGAQSFDDDELRMLGRGHSARQTVEAVQAAREAGFENVSMDLIYALPGQTVQGWRRTLEEALALEPEHLSAYGLELAEATPLLERYERGEIEPVGESEHLAMREATREVCASAGLARYEISNYARPGGECRHNITYWRNEPYLGIGAGAWSYLDGVRSASLREPAAWMRAVAEGGGACDYEERLGAEDALAEEVMMGLRMSEGLSLAVLRRRYARGLVDGLVERAERLKHTGLLEVTGDRIRLTPDGEALHSEVCVRLA